MCFPPAKNRNMGQVCANELINLACHERRANFLTNLASITYTNIILLHAVNLLTISYLQILKPMLFKFPLIRRKVIINAYRGFGATCPLLFEC
jgi:hypothetical protein